MSEHLGIRLPDGRRVFIEERQAVAPLVRRARKAQLNGMRADPRDVAQIAVWVAEHPGRLCTEADMERGDGTCGGKHPPAR